MLRATCTPIPRANRMAHRRVPPAASRARRDRAPNETWPMISTRVCRRCFRSRPNGGRSPGRCQGVRIPYALSRPAWLGRYGSTMRVGSVTRVRNAHRVLPQVLPRSDRLKRSPPAWSVRVIELREEEARRPSPTRPGFGDVPDRSCEIRPQASLRSVLTATFISATLVRRVTFLPAIRGCSR
jgi:hypothetical protein